jgi:TfoX/Sxy family transcriptional regulator of competence genes
MAFDEALASRIRALLVGSAGIAERRMFGGLAFLKHGHMFVGVTGTDLLARVGKEAHAAALARPHARAMDFTGKPMAGYVFVGAEGLAKPSALEAWVRACERFVAGLPPRAKK